MLLLVPLYLVVIIVVYVTAYLVSLYSMAVYIDPDEVETLLPRISPTRRGFLI